MANASNLVFLAVGRVFALIVLGVGFFLGGQNPSLFLWGLLVEEVISLSSLSARQILLTRRTGKKAGNPMAVYFAFPLFHLVFTLVFTNTAAGGLFASPGARRIAQPGRGEVGFLALAFLGWAAFDLIRWLWRGSKGKLSENESAILDQEARMSLFLPHITIIAGGFCMLMLKLGSWMAWGIIGGRLLFEVLSFSMAVSKAKKNDALEGQA